MGHLCNLWILFLWWKISHSFASWTEDCILLCLLFWCELLARHIDIREINPLEIHKRVPLSLSVSSAHKGETSTVENVGDPDVCLCVFAQNVRDNHWVIDGKPKDVCDDNKSSLWLCAQGAIVGVVSRDGALWRSREALTGHAVVAEGIHWANVRCQTRVYKPVSYIYNAMTSRGTIQTRPTSECKAGG